LRERTNGWSRERFLCRPVGMFRLLVTVLAQATISHVLSQARVG